MQGYILHMQKTHSEDMIVKILTPAYIKTLYRFYGARHSIINIGRKIDFEEELSMTFLPKLKHIMHLGFKWESDSVRYYIWQHFVKLFYKHLIDVYEIDEFYFRLLEEGAQKLHLQNPKRVVLEMYAKLLQFEGRAHSSDDTLCFICEKALGNNISLAQGFLFAHHSCVSGNEFIKDEIEEFLHSQSSILLDDTKVEKLWEILGLGL